METLTETTDTPSVAVSSEVSDSLDVPEGRRNLVNKWLERVKDSYKYWEDKHVWKQMKENQEFAMLGATKKWVDGDNYTVPIILRHINQVVAQLYAKNPTVVAKRRRKLHYKLWDGRSDTLEIATQAMLAGDPTAMQLVQEVLAARQKDIMYDRMGKTLEILWAYYVKEQECNFKQQLKAMVRRAKVCKVAYVKLCYQRILETRPEITAQISDVTSKIAAIEATLMQVADGEILNDDDARLEELKQNLTSLQQQETLLVREGPLFDFPRANEVFPDKNCRHLKSFAGAEFVVHWFDMSHTKILATYKKNVKGKSTEYKDKKEGTCESMARIYEVHDKVSKQCFVVCDGYPDYIKEPYEPDLKIERFYPFFPLVFNEAECDDNVYPQSDVESAKPVQEEYNRSREALRQHRIASKPYWVGAALVDNEELKKLADHAAHEIITIAGFTTGMKVQDLIMAGPTAPIDPNLYEVEMLFTDLLRGLGTQESHFGGTSDSTATESSIAENNFGTGIQSQVDDLDEMLSELASATAQVMLTELDKQTVLEIVGDGAVWPDLPPTREEVAKDLYLEIQAGSSGRPNQAADLANLERAAPLLIQIPGVNPMPLARKLGELLNIDVEELIAENLPSIQALNQIVAKAGAGQPGTGDPATDPAAQGAEGANNMTGPQQNENEPGPQPAYPTPMVA
jgi:hypothetical protein